MHGLRPPLPGHTPTAFRRHHSPKVTLSDSLLSLIYITVFKFISFFTLNKHILTSYLRENKRQDNFLKSCYPTFDLHASHPFLQASLGQYLIGSST